MGDEKGYGRSLIGTLSTGQSVHVAINREGVIHWLDGDEPSGDQVLHLWDGLELSWTNTGIIKIGSYDDKDLSLTIADAEAFLTRVERYGSPSIKSKVDDLWKAQEARTARHPMTHVGVLFILMVVAITLWHSLSYVEAAIVDNCVPISVEAEIARHVEPNFVGKRKKAHPKVIKAVKGINDRLVSSWSKENRELFKETMSVTVIDDPMINAFALPAGRIIVFSGLVAAAERPSQVAAVLAHEYSHVAHRDGMKRIAGQIKWQILYAYLAGEMSADQEFLLQRAESLSTLKYSRSMEERADRESLELMMKAGYDGRAAAEFFTIMLKKGPNILDKLNFLSDHPATPERVKYLEELIKEMEGQSPKDNHSSAKFDGDWEEIRRLARQGVNSK